MSNAPVSMDRAEMVEAKPDKGFLGVAFSKFMSITETLSGHCLVLCHLKYLLLGFPRRDCIENISFLFKERFRD